MKSSSSNYNRFINIRTETLAFPHGSVVREHWYTYVRILTKCLTNASGSVRPAHSKRLPRDFHPSDRYSCLTALNYCRKGVLPRNGTARPYTVSTKRFTKCLCVTAQRIYVPVRMYVYAYIYCSRIEFRSDLIQSTTNYGLQPNRRRILNSVTYGYSLAIANKTASHYP